MSEPIKPRPDLNGTRIQFQSRLAIYLVDQGFLRHVPDQHTYDQLFRNWDNLEKGMNPDEIPLGKPIWPGAYLAEDLDTGKVYFVEKSIKRHVVDPSVLEYYNFKSGDKISRVPGAKLEELLDGPPIELPPNQAKA